MTHDRMQPDVRFKMVEHGFILDVGDETGLMGVRYAFSTIEEVAAWFLDQYEREDARLMCYREGDSYVAWGKDYIHPVGNSDTMAEGPELRL